MMMKHLLLIFGLHFTTVAFSQNGAHVNGGLFKKSVEYNVVVLGGYNMSNKGGIEKLFFGDFNAPVEFIYEPSFKGSSGFRMMRDSSNTFYILEVKLITNYKEESKIACEEAINIRNQQMLDLPAKILDSLPRSVFNQIWEYNKKIPVKYNELLLKRLKVEIHSFPVSDPFAETMYKKMVSFIHNFKAKGIPPMIFDGFSVTFRTVIEDELWSLYIHEPQGYARKMTDFCRQIIEDAQNDQLDEKKYMDFLDAFEM